MLLTTKKTKKGTDNNKINNIKHTVSYGFLFVSYLSN